MPTQKEELQLNTQQDMSSEDMYVLKKLFTEYVSLYRLELNSGKYEILRLIANTQMLTNHLTDVDFLLSVC